MKKSKNELEKAEIRGKVRTITFIQQKTKQIKR